MGLNADDEVWDPTTFTKNRDRPREPRRILYFALRNVASGMTWMFFASEYVFSPGYTT